MKKIKTEEDTFLVPPTMHAMVMHQANKPLVETELPVPKPLKNQVLIKILACGVCRTDLHIMDGELKEPKLPLIMGHEIIGLVISLGREVENLKPGDWVGIPWLGFACGYCPYCLKEEENLCENALFTGYSMDGGYAEYTLAYADFCFHIPPRYANASGAPLLCAGLIGYRAFGMLGNQSKKIGIYGFGAAAHIFIQVALYNDKEIYAFTRDGDQFTQEFARKMGAVWAGSSIEMPPSAMDSSVIFAPVGDLVPKALKDLDKGGTVVCGGIHMSDIPSFPYELLWEERILRSVANLTRKDGKEFLEIAEKIPVKTETRIFPLREANEALETLRKGEIHGSVVLVME